LVVREQRTQIALDASAEISESAKASSTEFAKFARVYERHRESRVRPLRETYIGALKKMEEKLIGERKLKGALAVRKEIERLEPAPIEEPGSISKTELRKLLVGSKWDYRKDIPGEKPFKTVLKFESAKQAVFGASYRVEWRVSGDRKIQFTRGGKNYSVIELAPDLESFTGKASDGLPMSGKRSR